MNDVTKKDFEELENIVRRALSRTPESHQALEEMKDGVAELNESFQDLNQKLLTHLQVDMIHRDQINSLLRRHESTLYGENGDNGLVLKLSNMEQDKRTTEKNLASLLNMVKVFGTTGLLGFLMGAWEMLFGRK